MSYYFSKTLPVGFDEAVRRTTEALKKEGFGIITEIDVTQTKQRSVLISATIEFSARAIRSSRTRRCS